MDKKNRLRRQGSAEPSQRQELWLPRNSRSDKQLERKNSQCLLAQLKATIPGESENG